VASYRRSTSIARLTPEEILVPENFPPQTLAYLAEYTALNQPPITSGQIIGAARYAWQINVEAAPLSVTNTVTTTDIYLYTLAGGVLGTQGAVRLLLSGNYTNNTGAGRGLTLIVKYGGTTMFSDASGATDIPTSATARPWRIKLEISGANATNAQTLSGKFVLTRDATAPTTGIGSIKTADDLAAVLGGTAAIDSTLNKDVEVEIAHSNNDTSLTRTFAVLTKIAH